MFRSLARKLPRARLGRRFVSSEMDEYESMIYKKLAQELEPSNLSVRDISGGCGSMFAINIESPKFKGLPMIKQHRLVNELLKDEIAKWHGLQLKTKAKK
ncbi:hypothetical protein KL905_003296 [Ogataea polymorpha]|nr:hypothetical protein KL937_003066 [Ogataea polymorpha]KAG7888454.1 hypothetical protein KL936_003666 [Ogataea polymorpha]KAG7916123.1 hypothetical protein KL927_003588 [Ogataea polymorpha]KAG7920662.1 hypothetical protein KL905_003296 [Ogataea polymorpha]KAG7934913.1 hypothetical protein KL904_003245 [Ogataea polymorpha]